MVRIIPCIIFLLFINCSNEKSRKTDREKFSSELLQLKEYFKIPGIAAVIEQDGQIIYEEYLGESDIANNIKVDSTTLFPVASLTKIFSGLLTIKLEEQGKISLDDPVNKYLENSSFNDAVLIKHILSHTSQGTIGEQFYYSSRFGILTQVLEKATDKTFSELMNEEIITPLRLKNTFLLKDSVQISDFREKVASPYLLENGVKKGFIDYGYSSSAGIVSNAGDLIKLSAAMDSGIVINAENQAKMLSPFKEGLPYGYGVFSQKIAGLNIVWAYGQYDCYSSLFLKIPSKDLTLVLLANNNLMSDPARLIYGDLSSSLFAMSFLKNYVNNLYELKLFHNPDAIIFDKKSNPGFLKKLVLAQALSESFMARFDPDKLTTSKALLEQVFSAYSDYLAYADINLLHTLSFLKDVAFYMDLGAFDTFDTQIVQIGEKLLKETPNNPYVHSYLGTCYSRKGNTEKAAYHFRNILKASNFSRNWYTVEAEKWLAEYENKN